MKWATKTVRKSGMKKCPKCTYVNISLRNGNFVERHI